MNAYSGPMPKQCGAAKQETRRKKSEIARDETVDQVRNPYASLRWHYPDQVQRVFLTHAARTSNLRATQDPRVSSAHDTPAGRCLATRLEKSDTGYHRGCHREYHSRRPRPILLQISPTGMLRRTIRAAARPLHRVKSSAASGWNRIFSSFSTFSAPLGGVKRIFSPRLAPSSARPSGENTFRRPRANSASGG
ncbi:hypothetical protein bAD24_I18145 [Burkholderia sp. AD24]|nr:hypothetical protein bAD24_I18145 [Burkholderia sp. AD24]